jgi:fumarate reductase subunit D
MYARRPIEPFLWLLFSAGGVMAALFFPALLVLFGIAFPLGWIAPPDYDHVHAIIGHPLTRLVLLVVCSLALFHWAHRFRYTLYDGLQIKHLNGAINTVCYGGAIVGTLVAVYLLWRVT